MPFAFNDAYPEITRAHAPVALAAEEPAKEYDVAIIGAGFSGLSAAERLIARGLRVCVLEASTLGAVAASGRNAGKFLTGWVLDLPEIADTLAEHYAAEGLSQDDARVLAAKNSHAFFAMTVEGCERMPELAARYGIDAAIHRGAATLDIHENGEARAKDYTATLAQRGFPIARSISAQDVCSLFGTAPGYYTGGLFDQVSGRFHPGAMLVGLAEALQEKGLALYEKSPARGVAEEGGGLRVVSENGGAVKAKKVFMAGAHDEAINPATARRAIPLSAYVLKVEGAKGSEAVCPAGIAFDDTSAPGLYARRAADGAVYIGQEVTTRHTPAILERMRNLTAQKAAIVFPSLAGGIAQAATSIWAGTIYYNTAWMPELSFERGRAIVSFSGLGGYGNALSMIGGKTVGDYLADAIQGEANPATAARIALLEGFPKGEAKTPHEKQDWQRARLVRRWHNPDAQGPNHAAIRRAARSSALGL